MWLPSSGSRQQDTTSSELNTINLTSSPKMSKQSTIFMTSILCRHRSEVSSIKIISSLKYGRLNIYVRPAYVIIQHVVIHIKTLKMFFQ